MTVEHHPTEEIKVRRGRPPRQLTEEEAAAQRNKRLAGMRDYQRKHKTEIVAKRLAKRLKDRQAGAHRCELCNRAYVSVTVLRGHLKTQRHLAAVAAAANAQPASP